MSRKVLFLATLCIFLISAKAEAQIPNEFRPRFSVLTCDIASLNKKPVCLPEEFSQYYADELEIVVGDSVFKPMPKRADEFLGVQKAIAEGVANDYEFYSERFARKLNLNFEESERMKEVGLNNLMRIRFKNVNNKEELYRWLSVFAQDQNVRKIYFSSVVRIMGAEDDNEHTTNDPKIILQWYLYKEKFFKAHKDKEALWGSPDIHTTFFDSGIDLDHEDLPQAVGGFDYLYDVEGVADDQNGHGTAVAGVLLQVPNNNRGGIGTSPNVSFWIRRVVDAQGFGQWSIIAEAIIAQTNTCKKLREENPDVRCTFNFSIGGIGPIPSIDAALNYAYKEGIVAVAAAGNWPVSLDKVPIYPAAKPGTIPVAGLSQQGKLLSFSSYGLQVPMVGAGATGIWTTVPKGNHVMRFISQDGYQAVTGTSFASIQVVGAINLAWSKDRDLTREQIIFRTLGSSEAVPGLEKFVASGGILDAAMMLDAPKEKPASPKNFTITNTSHISIKTRHTSLGKALGFVHFISDEPFDETNLVEKKVKMITTISPSHSSTTFSKLLLNLPENTTHFVRMLVFDRGGNMSDLSPLLKTTTKKSQLFKHWTFTKETGERDPGEWSFMNGPTAYIIEEAGFANPILWHLSDMLPSSSGDALFSWRFGREDALDFLTGILSDTVIKSEIVDLSNLNGASLVFDYFQNTTTQVLWDKFEIYAIPIDRNNRELEAVFIKEYDALNNSTQLKLKEELIDLSVVAGKRFKLAFRLNAPTGGILGGLGWMFGNVKIFTDERAYLY